MLFLSEGDVVCFFAASQQQEKGAQTPTAMQSPMPFAPLPSAATNERTNLHVASCSVAASSALADSLQNAAEMLLHCFSCMSPPPPPPLPTTTTEEADDGIDVRIFWHKKVPAPKEEDLNCSRTVNWQQLEGLFNHVRCRQCRGEVKLAHVNSGDLTLTEFAESAKLKHPGAKTPWKMRRKSEDESKQQL